MRAAKTHEAYWKDKITKRPYKGPDGKTHIPPEYSVRFYHQKHTAWFNLDTPNASAAACRARDMYVFLLANGLDATVEKYKPRTIEKTRTCTLGEFLADVEKHHSLNPKTFQGYSQRLRRIVCDIANVEKSMSKRARESKHDYVNGGLQAWRAKVDKHSLDILTPESIAEWRNAYINKKGSNPLKRKSAERSAASYLRCCKALFSPDIIKTLSVNLPTNPFADIKIKDPGPQRYRSSIDPADLYDNACRDLKDADPQAFLALVLCLWGGLRRKEADNLLWEHVDLINGHIQIRRTKFFEPKTEESQRDIDIPQMVCEILAAYKKRSPFVMAGEAPRPEATYNYYRADKTWRRLVDWLKAQGIKDPKAVHSLRKESGSLIASVAGIEAARQHLGHRSIKTTSAHYVTKRTRVEVTLNPILHSYN